MQVLSNLASAPEREHEVVEASLGETAPEHRVLSERTKVTSVELAARDIAVKAMSGIRALETER
jgi:hypothetical protein